MTGSYGTDQAFGSFGARTDTRTLFGQTMGLVAVATCLFAMGAYLARNLPGGWGVVSFLSLFGRTRR
jgi:hypothetical protein